MAPLLPSESAVYSLALPDEVDDERRNLSVRTGAAVTSTRSSVVVHGGLTIGLSLESITLSEVRKELDAQAGGKSLLELVSNEIFYLNIVNRKWSRLELMHHHTRPQPRFFHAMTFHGSSLYVFGGLTVDEDTEELVPANDLWEFNLDALEWTCLDYGSTSGAVPRFDHSLVVSEYASVDQEQNIALVIAGGRGELNQVLSNVVIYDLENRHYVNTTAMNLTLNEGVTARNMSATSGIDPKSQDASLAKKKLKVVSDSSFIISGSTTMHDTDIDSVVHILAPQEQYSTTDIINNPLVTLPIIPNGTGVRLPLADSIKTKVQVVPNNLKYPSGGVFGPNIIVAGYHQKENEFQVYLFNTPSQKWTRLSIDTKTRTTETYLWKAVTWPSHHKLIVFGSLLAPPNAEFPTVQTFDMLVLVGLPITNIFHSFSTGAEVPSTRGSSATHKESKAFVNTSSFEEYSKYIAPSTKISSIRSIFPNYAVTLGRNAFERYGASLSDFEFITADGDKVPVPLMLLRKRWGRCFDRLLAKGYARAVHQLENNHDDDGDDDNSNDSHSVRSKKSVIVMNKAQQNNDRDVPHFRLPFQDSVSLSPAISIAPSSGHTSRKASVVSTGGASVTSNSTSGGNNIGGLSSSDLLDFDTIPPIMPFPNECPPMCDHKSPVRQLNSKDQFTSPRGSISGTSVSSGIGTGSASSPGIKLKDLRSSITFKKQRSMTSRSSSAALPGTPDDGSIADVTSNMDSIPAHQDATGANVEDDDVATLLEPLLIPRSLYLPFPTATVHALSEFLFTGQLGDRWLLTPTTSDAFLLSKFYELPLLYDLISEVMYAIIGKKEESLISEFGKLTRDYRSKLVELFNDDDGLIEKFCDEHPHVRETFQEIEAHLNTADDGYLNLSLLRKASKASTMGSSSIAMSAKNSFDMASRRMSIKSPARGKSSLSKQINFKDANYNNEDYEEEDDDDDDDLDVDVDDDADLEIDENLANEEINPKELKANDVASYNKTTFSSDRSIPLFKADTMSLKSNKSSRKFEDDENVDPITPLKNSLADLAITEHPVMIHTGLSDLDSDDRLAVEEAEVIDGRTTTYIPGEQNVELDDDDPLSTSGAGMSSGHDELEDEHEDPLSKTKTNESKAANEQQSSLGGFQVPEGHFDLDKDTTHYGGSKSSSLNQEGSTSDSDDMALGIGLISNLRLSKLKTGSGSGPSGAPIESRDSDEDAYLPTLENLASPSSPAPPDHLLQVIYEISSLACDMKLLLRSMNVLEMSKNFENRKIVLMAELDQYIVKVLAERDETTPAAEEKAQAQIDSPLASQISGVRTVSTDTAPRSPTRRPTLVHQTSNDLRLLPQASYDSTRTDSQQFGEDASVKSFKLRSTFTSIRSLSSMNLSKIGHSSLQQKGPHATSPSEASSLKSKHSLKNPFHRKRDDDGHKKSIISSILPARHAKR